MKLNQVIATEKGIKNRTTEELTKAYHAAQKPALFNGHSKVFKPLVEGSDNFPPDNKLVEVKAGDLFKTINRSLGNLLTVTAAKDYANCNARADLVVDGKVLLTQVPATYLLFLEKQLIDLRTSLNAIPVLDPSKTWNFDSNVNLFKSDAVLTSRTKKTQKPIVLYDATKEHPAQTQLITDDVVIGNWETVEMSGALSQTIKDNLLNTVEKLVVATKQAREAANMTDAQDVDISPVLNYIFG